MRKVFYEDKERNIRFIQNPREDSNSYHVSIGKDYFCLPRNTFFNLSTAETSTPYLQRILDKINPEIDSILKNNKLDYKDLHIIMLTVRKIELEEDLIASLKEEITEEEIRGLEEKRRTNNH